MPRPSPFQWSGAPNDKINFGWRDETILHDLERFWHLMKRGVTFQGLSADLLDGKDADDFGNVSMDPGNAGPQCNAICFGPPLDPADPGFGTTVPVQDSGVPTANIVTAPSAAPTAGWFAVSTGATKEVEWLEPSTVGDVIGPGGATSGNLPEFGDNTGKLLADSGISAAAVAALLDTATTKALNSANVAALTAFPVWHKVTLTFDDFIAGAGNVSLEALPVGTVWHMAVARPTEAFDAPADPAIAMEVASALPIVFIRSMNVKVTNQQPEVPNEGAARLWPPVDLGNSHTPVASLTIGGGSGPDDLTAGSVDIYLLLSKMA